MNKSKNQLSVSVGDKITKFICYTLCIAFAIAIGAFTIYAYWDMGCKLFSRLF